MAKYEVTNPTLARRVIYDGLTQRRIVVEPGETKSGVELDESVAAKFGDGLDGDRRDLLVSILPEIAILEEAQIPLTAKRRAAIKR
jgi:hypothetical protein